MTPRAVETPRRRSYRDSHVFRGTDYDRTFRNRTYRGLLWRLEREALDGIVPEPAAATLEYLDFACGTGRVLAYLGPRMKRATGVDVSPSMLAVARTKVQGAALVRADITRGAPFPARAFDLVTAFRFFPNAEPELRSAALAALRNLVRANGMLVFNNHLNRSSVRNRVKELVGFRYTGMDDKEVRALVARHGFRVERVIPIGVWPGRERARLSFVRALVALERAVAGYRAMVSVANDVIYVCSPT